MPAKGIVEGDAKIAMEDILLPWELLEECDADAVLRTLQNHVESEHGLHVGDKMYIHAKDERVFTLTPRRWGRSARFIVVNFVDDAQ